MKLFLHINAKKIENVISYFDNYLWNAGIQKNILYLVHIEEMVIHNYLCNQLEKR